VVTIEVNTTTYRFGEENLRKAGYEDVLVVEGDGSTGFPDEAPYDKICMTASASSFPEPLKEQLATPGRMVGPIGTGSRSPSLLGRGQDLVLLKRDTEGEEEKETIERVITSL